MQVEKKRSAYLRIYEDIVLKIKRYQYVTGNFLPSERTLSEIYEVKRPTIRHALELLCKNGYITKIHGAGNKVIYGDFERKQQNSAANTIVYVMPDSEAEQGPQPYHIEICTNLEKICGEKNYNLIFTKARIIGGLIPQWLYSEHVIGAIWVSNVSIELLETAYNINLPSIIFQNESSFFPKINLDDINGAYLATSHLIAQGCKQILHIAGMKSYIATERRIEGYKRALLTHGLPFNPENVLYGDWSYESGHALASKILDTRFDIDGVFAACDLMALGCMNAAIQKKYSIPNRIKIVGIDDIEQSRTSQIPISTIRFSQNEVAALLFLALNEVFMKKSIPNEILVPATLIVRESSGGKQS